MDRTQRNRVYTCSWPLDKRYNSSLWQALLEPYNYIGDVPGKEIRTRLIEAFNVWLQVPEDRLATIARIVRMLHTASLMYAAAVISGLEHGILT